MAEVNPIPPSPSGLGAIADLWPPNRQTSDPGLDLAPGTVPVFEDPLSPIGQTAIGKPGDEGICLRSRRRGQHLARALPGDPGQRIVHRMRPRKLDDIGIFSQA